ncbi:hypothetical protein OKW24_004385 [Peribacillus simplex]|uniref:hypothetical protein n=1 Tax=Peribacillus simplex TaxID=1478 RepID=UPI0024E1E3B1|nr:hypothetical protein [Peribacillus simplex]MDF9762612.1 hypothetical protein [Peribacillus simplex]
MIRSAIAKWHNGKMYGMKSGLSGGEPETILKGKGRFGSIESVLSVGMTKRKTHPDSGCANSSSKDFKFFNGDSFSFFIFVQVKPIYI